MLLSESELRAALEPLLDQLLVQRLRYFQLQLEPRLQSLIENALSSSAAATPAPIEALLGTAHPNQAFETLFAASAEWVGPARALLVVRHQRATVWKMSGLNLPASFPLDGNDLRAGTARPITVRNQTIGMLYWESLFPLGPLPSQRLDLALRIAGLVLLHQVHTPAAQPPPESVQAPARELPATAPLFAPASAPAPRSPEEARAQRFAQLLIDDLEIYLRAERAAELAAARQSGTVGARFAVELERCRQAFLDRFPPAGGLGTEALEEAVGRILCRAV